MTQKQSPGGVPLKTFSKFTGKHLPREPFSSKANYNFTEKDSIAGDVSDVVLVFYY